MPGIGNKQRFSGINSRYQLISLLVNEIRVKFMFLKNLYRSGVLFVLEMSPMNEVQQMARELPILCRHMSS